jgi:hypothetical protein
MARSLLPVLNTGWEMASGADEKWWFFNGAVEGDTDGGNDTEVDVGMPRLSLGAYVGF